MNINIFPTGKGGSESAVKYLLSDTDHEGKKRSVMPEILFGDPNTFIEIANATRRQHKYTSGVIAFRDDETVTADQITTLIETFRSTFMPSLEVDKNFADFWVMHRDKSNVELHFLVANTELQTGQQLNIHPPGEKNIQFFNAFSAVMNDTFGFAQVVAAPLKISLKPFEAKSPNGKKNKKAKDDFAKVLHTEIVNGFICNRNQLIGYLKRHNVGIPKIGDEFITVRLPGARQNTRLTGPLFAKDSDYLALVAEHHQSKIPKFLTPSEAAQQKAKLITGIEARTAFNVRRYLTAKPGAKRTHRDIKRTSAHTATQDRTKPAQHQEIMSSDASTNLDQQIHMLKAEADPHPLAAPLDSSPQRPHQRADPATVLMGGSAVGGMEAQIGVVSMQYHNLLLLLASANGKRAITLKAQILVLEQKLIALNLELEKKKTQAGEKLTTRPT